MTEKEQIFKVCFEFVENRIAMANGAIRFARESSQSETKSSAGDKYETGRAMAQLEVENNLKQLAEAQKLMHTLQKIDCARTYSSVQLGSLVHTGAGRYFIAISMGEAKIKGQAYMVISPASPVGQAMLGKKVGDEFFFGGKKVKIDAIS